MFARGPFFFRGALRGDAPDTNALGARDRGVDAPASDVGASSLQLDRRRYTLPKELCDWRLSQAAEHAQCMQQAHLPSTISAQWHLTAAEFEDA